MIETEAVSIILAVGGLLPLLTAVFQQPKWSSRTRATMSVIISVLAGLVAYVSANGMAFDSASAVVVFVVGVILASAASYESVWKPTGIAGSIENSTAPRRARIDDVDPKHGV